MNQEKVTSRDFENEEITIDLTELFMALWSKIHLIILAGILMAFVAFAGTKLLITPMYTSTTSMYVLTRTGDSSGVTYNDLQTGTQLTQDYMELVKSRPVLEQVIAVLNLDMTTAELSESIATENAANTRILTVSVENEDPKMAKEIADALRESVSIKITEIMEADAVNTIEEDNLPTAPSSPNVMRNIAIGALLGILIAAGIIILIFILDDTIKTPDDVEHYLGLNVLTSIPIAEGAQKTKKVKGLSSKKLQKQMKR